MVNSAKADEGCLSAETDPSPVCDAAHRSHPLPQGERGRTRAQLICPTGTSRKIVSSPIDKNISLFPTGKSSLYKLALSRLIRGALRGRHERWVRDAVDVAACRRTRWLADGEVVWS
jgi:hypothetical protein